MPLVEQESFEIYFSCCQSFYQKFKYLLCKVMPTSLKLKLLKLEHLGNFSSQHSGSLFPHPTSGSVLNLDFMLPDVSNSLKKVFAFSLFRSNFVYRSVPCSLQRLSRLLGALVQVKRHQFIQKSTAKKL